MDIVKFNDIYVLEGKGVRAFLILGEEEALLIDTCFEEDHIDEIVKKITDLPLSIICTHGDRDHIGGMKYFDECYIHQNEVYRLESKGKPLDLSKKINIGNYSFEIIWMPGHTTGSCMLYDEQQHILIGGDVIQRTGPIFMFGKERNLEDYILSLESFEKKVDQNVIILPSHHEYPCTFEDIHYCIEDAKRLQAKTLPKKKHDRFDVYIYQGKHVSFLAE